MKESKKIIRRNNCIDIVTTQFNESFIGSINKKGRPVHDFNSIDEEQFRKCLSNKLRSANRLKGKLDDICKHNDFTFYITLFHINRLALKKAIDRLHSADKCLKFVVLASWTQETGLYYNILLKTELPIKQVRDKLKALNSSVKEIYSLVGLVKYLKGVCITYNTCYILKQYANASFKDRQIDILSCSKLLSTSKNIITSEVIRNPTVAQLNEAYLDAKNVTSFNYTKLDSNVTIEKLYI